MIREALLLVEVYQQEMASRPISTVRSFFHEQLVNSPVLQKQQGTRPFLNALQGAYSKMMQWERSQQKPQTRPDFPELKKLINFIAGFLNIMTHQSAHDAPPLMYDFVQDISEVYARLILAELSSDVLTSTMRESGILSHRQFLQDYQPQLWYEVYVTVHRNPKLEPSFYMRHLHEKGARYHQHNHPGRSLDWTAFQALWLAGQLGKYADAFFGQYPELAVKDYQEFHEGEQETEGVVQQFLSIRFVEALSAVLDQVTTGQPNSFREKAIGKNKKEQLQSIYQVLSRCTNYREGALIPLVDVIGPIPPGQHPDGYLHQLHLLLDWYHAVFEGLLEKHIPFILYYPNLRVFHKTAQIQELLRGLSTIYGCPHCGTPIDQGTETCPQCQSPQEKCAVCRGPITFGDTVGRCLHCETNFHEDHLMEWLKSHPTCPHCRQELSEDKVQSFRAGLAEKFKGIKKIGR